MKKSILTVILAAVICSITQTGFAADFVFKMAGIQVKKLPADIEKVRTIPIFKQVTSPLYKRINNKKVVHPTTAAILHASY